MENMDIVATTKTENGLDYNEPEIQYSPGKTFEVKEVWGVWVDGKVRDVFIKYLKIESVNVEYVVNESEWYVNYEVSYHDRYTEINREKLTNEDLEEI